jgi:hypothetical protein
VFGSEIAWTRIDSGSSGYGSGNRGKEITKINLTKFNFIQINSPLVFVMDRKILTSVLKVKYPALLKIEKYILLKTKEENAKINFKNNDKA